MKSGPSDGHKTDRRVSSFLAAIYALARTIDDAKALARNGETRPNSGLRLVRQGLCAMLQGKVPMRRSTRQCRLRKVSGIWPICQTASTGLIGSQVFASQETVPAVRLDSQANPSEPRVGRAHREARGKDRCSLNDASIHCQCHRGTT